jgi:ATP-binding cassette, subfamily B, bacterial
MARPQTLRGALPSLWRIGAYFWPELRKHKALITTAMLGLFAEAVLRMIEPWPLKFVFDRILGSQPDTSSKWLPSLNSLDNTQLLTGAAVTLVIVIGLRAYASYRSTIGFAQIGNRVLTRVRSRLYRHVQYLSLSFHTKARTGDLVVRVIGDVGMLQDVAVTGLLPMLAKVLHVTGMIGVMFWLNWRLALVAISVLPLFWLRTATLTRRIRAVAQKQRQREGAMAATAAESISAIKVVQALSLEEKFMDSFAVESERSLKQDVKGKRLAAGLGRSVDVMVALATALVLWYGATLVLRGEFTAGGLIVFLFYLKYAYRPIQDFAKYTTRMAKASAAGERVMDLLDRVPEVRDLPDAVRAPLFAGRVQFDGVCFDYEHGQDALRQVTFEARPGEHVAIVGPSGAGKSTLVSLILRLYDPKAGRVLIDGEDIRGFKLDSLRGQISVVLQDNLLFLGTIRENIAFASSQATEDEIIAAAKLARAHEFISGFPLGYETMVGERGVTLSHGQRQRIAIARAAMRKAPIVILDEPTTGLDQSNEAAVISALAELCRGRTTFLITHDLQHASNSDVILYLEAGCIMERGTHLELLRANGRYARTYALQAEHGAQRQLASAS